jgi:TRAP-type transport system periplasmic protein
MDGKRTLVLRLLAVASLVGACSSAPAVAQGGPSAATATNAPVATPSGVLTKNGGVAETSLKAALATVIGEGIDEQDLADTLRASSDGAIDVTISPNWRQPDINSETELIQDVAAGKAQLGIVGLRAFDTVGVTSFMGIQAPFVIDSFDLESKVLATDWAVKLLDGTRIAGVVGIGYVQGPLRQPLGVTRKLTDASSFQGARFGIRPSKVSEMTLTALGATPVGWSDLKGLDGIEMDVPSINNNKYDMAAKSLTGNVVLWARPSAFFANAAWFDGLSADQQQTLRAAVAAVDGRTIDRVKKDAALATDVLCHRSVAVTNASDAALAELRQKTQPVIDELEQDPGTKATIDAISSLRGSATTEAFGPCSQASASGAPANGSTALDGTWKTSFTKDELASSPLLMDVGEASDDNWGDLTLTFGNGRVTSTQQNNVTHGTASGTFTVNGDVLAMSFDQGGNQGEVFTMHWSIFKNTLTFRRDDAIGIGPTPFLVKSWTKAG